MKQFHIPMPVRYGMNTILIIALLLVGHLLMESGVLPRAHANNVIQVGFFIILAVSLNLTAGYLGQLPLGHAGFMAVGAYVGAIFWRSGLLPDGASIVVGLLFAGLVAALFGVMIGIPALRLRGDYLAIITLGFGEMIRVLINNIPTVTGGAQGLLGIPRHSSFLVVYICVVITCVAVHMLMKSRHGRAILSIRENEIAAESCGINTTYYKVMAFAFSAFFAGVAGALFAGNLGILVPGEFGFMTSINILMIVVLGGMGSMAGAVIAAAILTSLPLVMQGLAHFHVISYLPGASEHIVRYILQWIAQHRMIIYALLLIIAMIAKPTGLLGNYDFSLSRILEKLIRRRNVGKAEKGGADHG
ncbi:MAG: branched-chain amino acid ABC transporter permease [Oscillospiraceae bacterium]|nr:branched-chain amino acid ABC transporter permease [Oscillospiraceae bacterium]